MVKIVAKAQEEFEKEARESRLENFLKENTPKGYHFNGHSTFYDCPTFLHKATWAFRPRAFSVDTWYNFGKPKINVSSQKYFNDAFDLAQKMEEEGLEEFYGLGVEELVIKKDYRDTKV